MRFQESMQPLRWPTSAARAFTVTVIVLAASRSRAYADVAGIVIDSAGMPAANVAVMVRAFEHSASAKTDRAGRFTLSLPERSRAAAECIALGIDGTIGYWREPWEPASGESQELRIELKPPRLLEVRVSCDGQPAAGAEVVVCSSYQLLTSVVADADGVATLAVPSGVQLGHVMAVKPGVGVDYLAFRPLGNPVSDPYQLAQDHSGPLNLLLTPIRAVEIRVVDRAGQPMSGVRVSPWYISLPKKGGYAQVAALWSKQTDERGLATLDYVPMENEHALQVGASKPGFVTAERLNVDPLSDQQQFAVTLLPLVPVHGKVVFPDGAPAAEIPVRASGSGYQVDGFHGEAITAADGSFQLDVEPDQFCLFVAGNREWASYMVGRIVRLGEPVEEIELRLAKATRIYGRVTQATGDAPVADIYVQLYQRPEPDYYDLPESQQLPNPTGTNRAVVPMLVRSVNTDANGAFEFFVGPGDYYAMSPNVAKPPQFVIDNQAEFEINLVASGAAPSNRATLKGRVVLGSDPQQGVPEVRVFGYPLELQQVCVSATTDAEGRFESRRCGSAALVGCFNADHSLGAVVQVDADAAELILALEPTATLRGLIIDDETGLPAANREVVAAITIKYADSTMASAFGENAATDNFGRYEIDGIATGHEYDISVITGHDNEGQPNLWRPIGKATAAGPGPQELAELHLPKVRRPPTLEDRIDGAFGDDGVAQRLERILRDARLCYEQVLIWTADPTSKATRQFLIAADDSEGLRDYKLLAVDAGANQSILEQRSIATPAADGGTLAVLNPSGELVAQCAYSYLSQDGALEPARLAKFLADHRAAFPDASQLLSEAQSVALRDGKSVLVQFSGPACAPCVRLARFLDSERKFLSKDYVLVKLDERMANSEAAHAKLGPALASTPWMAITAPDGTVRITSDGPNGNIGYPQNDEDIAHFQKMLLATRQRLSESDVETLLERLMEERKP